MDQETLATLKRMVRPIEVGGAFTLESASSVVSLNFEVARFHAAVIEAERILGQAGVLDERFERELVGRALELARERHLLLRSGAAALGALPPATA